MDKLEYRSVIRFLVLEGIPPMEIYTRMLKAYGKIAPSASTVKKWAAEFKKGRISINDDPREGRPKCATGQSVVQKVLQEVLKNRRIKVREIAETVEVSTGSAFEILTKQLELKKLFGHWVSVCLTNEEKAARKSAAETCLQLFADDNSNSLERCIMLGQTWVHIYETETKIEPNAPPTKLRKTTTKSSAKMLALIFWDAAGPLIIYYVEKEQKIFGEFLANLLGKLYQSLLEKRGKRTNDTIYFYTDLVIDKTDAVVLETLEKLNIMLLQQPKQSPDLSPTDFYLFPKLENFLQQKKCFTTEMAIENMNKYFYDLHQSNYKEAVTLLRIRWLECLKLNGNYNEPHAKALNPETEANGQMLKYKDENADAQ